MSSAPVPTATDCKTYTDAEQAKCKTELDKLKCKSANSTCNPWFVTGIILIVIIILMFIGFAAFAAYKNKDKLTVYGNRAMSAVGYNNVPQAAY